MKVTVIIPTYNRGHFIRITLESLLNQSLPKDDYEIIIADNNSSDDTAAIVQNFIQENPDRNITYFIERRQGVHYARNSAAKIAKGDFLYFTDDDMIADHMLLEELLFLFTLDEKVASVTGKILPKWLKEPPDWILKYCNNAYLSLNNPPDLIHVSKNDCNVYSCHQMIKKEIFFHAGGFNPENTSGLWLGDGETGLNIKIKQAGGLFGYNAKSVIYHMIPEARLTQKYLNKRLYNQGFCDSYTNYRAYRFSKSRMIYQIGKFLLLSQIQLVKALLQMISGKLSWHVELSRYYYFLARIKYNYKLISSESWRSMVLKSDWLDE